MNQKDNIKEKLLVKAKKQYQVLLDYCTLLHEEGYWERPQSILKQSIYDLLDCYLQAILVQQSEYCNRLKKEEMEFILQLPNQNTIVGLEKEQIIPETLKSIKKFLANPPILIQLCGLRDKERDSDVAGQFLDGILNIMLAVAYYENPKEDCVLRYVQDYYSKVNAFLDFKDGKCKITPRYLFLKLSRDGYEECCSLYEKYEEAPKRVSEPADNRLKTDSVYLVEEKEARSEDEETYLFDEESSASEYAKELEFEIETYEEETKQQSKDKLIEKEEKIQSRLEELIEALSSLTGLSEVKEEVKSLVNLIKVKKMREDLNMPSMEMTYHMVFTGNPGTGKTTVARLIAEIYKELGILSKGIMVETDRAGLVAGYVGQTALKVKEVVDKAIGGVLFIDEAYALTNNTVTNDFGLEAVDTLVKMMEDNRNDLVVIVAGYKKEMNEFLSSNTGLVSRFNKFIDFRDYSSIELLQIMEVFAEKSGVDLEPAAKTQIKQKISRMTKARKTKFGNARGIRNCFEKIMVNQANRIVTYEQPTIEQLKCIKAEDADFTF